MIKCILISFLLCITFSQMGKGNTNESQIQDIESSIIISTQEKKYFVVQLLRGLTEEGFNLGTEIIDQGRKLKQSGVERLTDIVIEKKEQENNKSQNKNE